MRNKSTGGTEVNHNEPSLFSSPFHSFAVLCLKDLSIFVPDPILVGDIATLTCNFDLETVSGQECHFLSFHLIF